MIADMEPTFFASPAAFRKWLERRHDKESEVLLGFYKKGSGKPSITWPESVDQALCFGWIDGVRTRIDDESYTIRFSPRKRGSNWSAINIRRVAGLVKLGFMHAAGLRNEQAPSYRRVTIHWVMSAKKEETRERRLAALIDNSAKSRRLL
jgi:uncharacterized protein YdeI (YjbR/CyaY-like superfamily)